ncbi:unnamed protein product [Rhizoctonia solani]|uniref:Uncharacterized protein n=1 Tax=Rhizoctonia solani TaxID=456999 RepID=A0A8H3H9D6_9AGAM|nr:unnamed protein product [Rhizoctonia solani]
MEELPFHLSTDEIPGLSLSIFTPESVATVDGLYVTTTLTNTGNHTVKLINAPETTLFDLPTDTFKITSEHGSPEFVGVMVKFSFKAAIAGGGFITLAPGGTYTSTHQLAKAYNFDNVGPGLYQVHVLEK